MNGPNLSVGWLLQQLRHSNMAGSHPRWHLAALNKHQNRGDVNWHKTENTLELVLLNA
jgi:hypothetical protein